MKKKRRIRTLNQNAGEVHLKDSSSKSTLLVKTEKGDPSYRVFANRAV